MAKTPRFVGTMVVGTGLLCGASTAFAQIPAAKADDSLFAIREIAPIAQPRPTLLASAAAAQLPAGPVQPQSAARPASKGPKGLMPALYAGDIALQVMDTHSTFRALDAGLVEQNPVMRWSTSHPAAFVSMKAAATASTILVAETIRRKHPRRAAMFMVGINAAYALIAIHNYRAVN
jgi:hypothetical protein